MIHNRKRNINKIIVELILFVITIILIFPLVWMFFGAFKNGTEATAMPPHFLPSHFNFNNFSEISKLFPLERFLFNSIIVAVIATVAQMLFCSMAGYVFAKIKFKSRELLFGCFLVTMMIPMQLTMIPLFKIFVSMHLENTYLGLILPETYNVIGIFLMRQHIKAIPDSFMEAAFLDGASHFTVFFKIILPLCKPALATLAVLSFMGSWNNLLWPLIITSSDKLATLPLGLTMLQGRWNTSWNLLMAGNLISFIPVLLVYILTQKYFIKSITFSGIKG